MLLEKLLELLRVCPTCGKTLTKVEGTTVLRCVDLYHGRFIVERTTKGGFFITYEPTKRAMS